MKAVLMSIQPNWCALIASEKKTLEVRKTKPKLPVPFKVYIYCTANKQGTKDLLEIHSTDGKIHKANSKVIGEFVCNKVEYWQPYWKDDVLHIDDMSALSCVDFFDLMKYANGGRLYGFRISELKIYDKPKELSEFRLYNVRAYYDEELRLPMPTHEISRPPQSWCYVEELQG